MNCSKNRSGRGLAALRLVSLLGVLVCGMAESAEFQGQVKLQTNHVDLPDDSLLRNFSDDPSRDHSLDLRLNSSANAGAWSWRADYQLILRRGDQIASQQQIPVGLSPPNAFSDDDRRVFDLSHRLSERDNAVIGHRLDRFYLARSSTNTVLKLGRQAVSWGNGLLYNPVDFFNPFDPAAIDTEYKSGDDMLYVQYLFDNGDDLQAVWVGRRDPANDVEASVSSLAIKYHGFTSLGEYDWLLAEHFDAAIAAIGGSIDFADAIWRSDIMLTETDGDRFTTAVINWSYALIAWDKNLSIIVEYFHNGFGIDDGDYAPRALLARPALLERLGRGELFTPAENYLALAATIELAPLWRLTNNFFINLDDDSRLLQIYSQHDLQQDLQLLVALNLPGGDNGSEFGGIDSGSGDQTLGVGASLFAQLAWYF